MSSEDEKQKENLCERKRENLALDFVNWVFGVFDIGCVGGGDPTRIREDRDGVGENAHEGDEGENDGVEDARGGHEAEPAFYEDEDCGQVYVQDGQNDDGYRYREAGAILHCFWWREIEVSEPTGVKTTASPGAEVLYLKFAEKMRKFGGW